MSPAERIVVLDVHGVIFTNPLAAYLAELAQRHGRESAEVLDAWTSRLRRAFWLGHIDVPQMWRTLFPGADPEALTHGLEQRYAEGPLFDLIHEIAEPQWLLSNHRTEWLMPRLERFGLADHFERIYVSDAIGFVKPDAGAFRMARAAAGSREVTYVDDKPENVAAAAGVFENAMTVSEAIERIRT
jgi:putative hydrolase of the HAD superfamily